MQEGASADRRGEDNKIQRLLFPLLQRRGIADAWANAEDARHEITAECHKLSDDAAFMSSLEAYLASNLIIRASFESVLAQLALAAGVRWQETSPILHPLSRRGWHIGRWLPTFLLVEGPLGRLVKDRNSPLGKRLRTTPDFLYSARPETRSTTIIFDGSGMASPIGHLSGLIAAPNPKW